jgi:CDP-paratose 2-epimerase
MLHASSTSTPESILITGGAGFVGSTLALHLKAAFPTCRITCMDNLYRKGSELNVPRIQESGISFHHGDIRDRAQFPEGPFEVILECSAEPSVLAGYHESPDYLMQTNLMGTYQCLEQARLWKSKTVFFSTSRVYPIAPLEAHPWRETETRYEWMDLEVGSQGAESKIGKTPSSTPHAPSFISSLGVREELLLHAPGARSLYGFTKYASELLIEEYRQAFGLPAVINRCSVLAGPWQFGKSDQGVVALWVIRHLLKKPLSYIGYGGTGKQVRDVLHAADLAELVERQLRAFPAWEGWCGNVGGGRETSCSLLELTGLCREATGISLDIGHVTEQRQADLRIFLADCARLKTAHGWKPRRELRTIVEDIAAWLEANPAILDLLGKS